MANKTSQDIEALYKAAADKSACVICKVDKREMGSYICSNCSNNWRAYCYNNPARSITFYDWAFEQINNLGKGPADPVIAVVGIPQHCIKCGVFNEYQSGPYTCFNCRN